MFLLDSESYSSVYWTQSRIQVFLLSKQYITHDINGARTRKVDKLLNEK